MRLEITFCDNATFETFFWLNFDRYGIKCAAEKDGEIHGRFSDKI